MGEQKGISAMLDVTGWRCLVVGGGPVAVRRASSLLEAGAVVTVIAPGGGPGGPGGPGGAGLDALPVERIQACYDPQIHGLAGYRLVVVATDDPQANAQITEAIAQLPLPPLCNRADEHEAGDLAFMAAHRDGPLTLAVHTGGASAAAAVAIRDAWAGQLDPVWPGLLAVARETRAAIKRQVVDPAQRTGLLRRLTDPAAQQAYRAGGAEALRAHYRDMMPGSA